MRFKTILIHNKLFKTAKLKFYFDTNLRFFVLKLFFTAKTEKQKQKMLLFTRNSRFLGPRPKLLGG